MLTEDKYCNDPECEKNRNGIKHKFHGRKIKTFSEKKYGIIAPILFVLVLVYMAPGPDRALFTPLASDLCNYYLSQPEQPPSAFPVCWEIDVAVSILIFSILGVIAAYKIKSILKKKLKK